jgi:hypothetical protein
MPRIPQLEDEPRIALVLEDALKHELVTHIARVSRQLRLAIPFGVFLVACLGRLSATPAMGPVTLYGGPLQPGSNQRSTITSGARKASAQQPDISGRITESVGEAGAPPQGTAIGFGETIDASKDDLRLLPARVVVPADIQPMFEGMWRRSPTFRRQYARLVDESVAVVVRLVASRSELGGAAARSQIVVQQGQVVSVAVALASTLDLSYLAHEIEHVLEQLDGVDLTSAVAHGMRGVTRSGPDGFETARAIRVGAQVASEQGMLPHLQRDAPRRSIAPQVPLPRRR